MTHESWIMEADVRILKFGAAWRRQEMKTHFTVSDDDLLHSKNMLEPHDPDRIEQATREELIAMIARLEDQASRDRTAHAERQWEPPTLMHRCTGIFVETKVHLEDGRTTIVETSDHQLRWFWVGADKAIIGGRVDIAVIINGFDRPVVASCDTQNVPLSLGMNLDYRTCRILSVDPLGIPSFILPYCVTKTEA